MEIDMINNALTLFIVKKFREVNNIMKEIWDELEERGLIKSEILNTNSAQSEPSIKDEMKEQVDGGYASSKKVEPKEVKD